MPVYPRNQRPLQAALAADRQRTLEKAKIKAAMAEKTEYAFGDRNDLQKYDTMDVTGNTRKARNWLSGLHRTSQPTSRTSKPHTSDYQSL
ncbi:hypothetical protein CORC01_09897 [Colletotrichum orchidophilum]|uniref:Uncharacterized protein n=1 Tax=Colletotrichum orchidophilum TaxID=1209926 RepID=A0A1G4B041_9PEZI|nr:uncharacterized protein CORC01_09897 [Colletotrichum orchidophilum]OHE94790.1 hypothetical protein CORC01_09897 [Colletotrichum orchidophilum]